MLKKYAGVILVAAICVSLAIAALIAGKNTEAPSDEAVSETNASMEGKNAEVLPDEVISEPVASCTSHTPWNLITTEWVDAKKDDPASNGHYEKEIVWALCKDCGTPFFYETGKERAIKPSIVNMVEKTPQELIEDAEEVITTTYYEMSDGTWKTDDHTYQHKLVISGRLNNAVRDITYTILSNVENITFEQAWKASGLSSNMDDYFKIEDAVFVAVK